VNTPRYPFRLKLGFFLPQQVGYHHDFPFEFDFVKLNETFSLRNFEGIATVSRTPQGLLLQGNFSGDTELQCVRCLKDYTHRLNWEMTELYAFSNEDAEEDDLLLPDNAEIDIEEFIREDAQLDIPINPVCNDDCQGLCQVCGVDLNLEDCGHDEAEEDDEIPPDSPFAGLKDLR
jgi:uncharacterized protein